MKRMRERVLVFAVLAVVLMTSGCSSADKQVLSDDPAAASEESFETEEKMETAAVVLPGGGADDGDHGDGKGNAASPEKEAVSPQADTASSQEETWEDRVAKAILSENQGMYAGEECVGEGHRILDMESEGPETRVYALTMYGEYQFQNDNFVKAGGTGVLPVVLVFEGDADSGYTLSSYERPEDGGGYLESIQSMFPQELQDICISPPEEVQDDLESQEQHYAAEYLKKLGRTAPIGTFRDFEHTILTEAGVSVEVSNDLVENRALGKYPLWIGTVEQIEDGVRYVYRKDYDPEKKKIMFTKTEYDSGTVVESHTFHSETGEEES